MVAPITGRRISEPAAGSRGAASESEVAESRSLRFLQEPDRDGLPASPVDYTTLTPFPGIATFRSRRVVFRTRSNNASTTRLNKPPTYRLLP